MIIIHISGIAGSGKTYICSQIKNATCISTDDIMYEIKKEKQFNSMTPTKWKHIQKLMKLKITKIIELYKNRGTKILVFEGITFEDEVPQVDYKFFIKIDDLQKTFRRVVIRELNKLINAKEKIIVAINQTPINNISNAIDTTAKIAHWQDGGFPPSFKCYKAEYLDLKHEYIQRKYKLKTQTEIINLITSI